MNQKETAGKIKNLKREMNAVILAHTYQEPEIQQIGDFVGDSLGLCIQAAKTDAEVIVFCGVHFMAESAKLLNPDKLVLLPDINAGCPMADMAEAEELRELKRQHPGAVVVTYINSTADVKAESDICCTSSNAVKIVDTIPEDKEIIFVPDQNLGKFVAEKTGRALILWPGFCPVHHLRVTADDISRQREEHPDALVLVHPECPPVITGMADFVGSTSQIIEFCRESGNKEFIIGTEKGILYPLTSENPDKVFIPASADMECRNMKKITLEKVLQTMETGTGAVELDSGIAGKALAPIRKMLDVR